jgi:hypothetical protein
MAGLYLLGDLLGAWFHSADDHNIANRLSRDPAGFSGWWDLWMNSEVANFGNSERYRPTLWGVQALEIVTFGANPGAMYAVRIVFFAVLLGALLFTLQQTTNWMIAAALGVYIANFSVWSDAFARSLVIPEAHAAAFFGVALIGITTAIQRLNSAQRADAPVLVAAIGMAVAAGAKENFVFLAAPVLALIVYALFRHRLSWWVAAICFVMFASPAAVAWTIYNYVAAQGADFYGRDASPSTRLSVLATWAPPAFAITALMASLLVAAFLSARFIPERKQSIRKHVYWTGLVLVVAGLWWAWEVVFYNGDILHPTAKRYGFPAALIIPLCLAAAAHLALQFARSLDRTQQFMMSALVGAAVLLMAMPLVFPVRHAAAAKAESTRAFHAEVRAAADLFNQHPDWPIIAEKVGFSGPELPFSAHIWLRMEGVRNPLFLRLHPEAGADSRSPFDQQVWRILQRASAEGSHGFTPFDQFDPSAEQTGACYSLSWEGRFPSQCQQAVFRIPEMPQVWRDGALRTDR